VRGLKSSANSRPCCKSIPLNFCERHPAEGGGSSILSKQSRLSRVRIASSPVPSPPPASVRVGLASQGRGKKKHRHRFLRALNAVGCSKMVKHERFSGSMITVAITRAAVDIGISVSIIPTLAEARWLPPRHRPRLGRSRSAGYLDLRNRHALRRKAEAAIQPKCSTLAVSLGCRGRR
jgi:hypothetical protein